MIYIDPTEADSDTRLPADVLARACIVPELEEYTGADWLVTPYALPIPFNFNIMPHVLAFSEALKSGVLVQRKSSLDLINSIPHLDDTLLRMQRMCPRAVLLTTGAIQYVPGAGTTLIGNRQSDMTWAAVEGALTWWDLRGGSHHTLHSDAEINGWLQVLEHALDRALEAPTKVVRAPMQTLVRGDWSDALVYMRVGLGAERAQAVQQYCGSFAEALQFLSDEDHAGQIAGVGPTTIAKVREYLGLKPDEIMTVLTRSDGDEWWAAARVQEGNVTVTLHDDADQAYTLTVPLKDFNNEHPNTNN